MGEVLILEDGLKHGENELEREFGVFSLEPCPQHCSCVVRSLQGCRTRRHEWLFPSTGSLLLGEFISALFQPFTSERNLLPSFPCEEQEGSKERQHLQRWDSERARSLLGRLGIRVLTLVAKHRVAANLRHFPLNVDAEDLMEREVRL